MSCNPIVNYGPFTIIYQSDCDPCKWCYHIVRGGPKVPVPKPVGLQQNNSLSVIIPLCNNLEPCDISNPCVTGAESFEACVGLDSVTSIYGIRFDITNPNTSFTICFCTLPLQAENQPLGLTIDGTVFNDQEICSPGCTLAPHKCCCAD